MINKIYTYGDSFSYPFWMEEKDTYTYKLSHKLGVDYVNRSFPALCHNEIFQRLLRDMSLFQREDLIIYQFTAYAREGYMLDEKNDIYYSSASLCRDPQETAEILNKHSGGRDRFPITDEELMILWDYIINIGDKTTYYKYHRVNDLAKFLEKEKKVRVIFAFLDSHFEKYTDDRAIRFPLETKQENVSIFDWVAEKKMRLVDSKIHGIHPGDGHPNAEAHSKIAESFHEYLIRKNFIL